MSDDVSTLQAQPITDTIYTVQVGDSLSKIAQKFYGSPDQYTLIASRNNVLPTAILYIGQRLIIPPLDSVGISAPTSPGGSVPTSFDDQVIETVTTTAPRLRWYQDWRIWVAAGVGVIGLMYLLRDRKRS